MNTHADKTQENKSQLVSIKESQIQRSGQSTFQFVDNRPESIAQKKIQEMANNSPQIMLTDQLSMNHSDKVIQRAWIDSGDGTLHWDPYIDGVEWIMLESGHFYYEVRNPAMLEQYGETAGIKFAQPRENWVQERMGRVPKDDVDPYVNDPSVVVPGAQELRRNNGSEMGLLANTMEQWRKSTDDGQYHSLIDGIDEYAKKIDAPLRGWKAKIHLGAVFHSRQIYIAFKYIVEEDHIVLDKIVKTPNSRKVATKDENEGLNRSAHSFLSSQTSTELDADNEGLVETYYKYGYRLKSDYFTIDRPEAIDQERWEQHQPNVKERGVLRPALNRANKQPGLMWRMVREM